jgi:hypothetical protein
MLLSAPQEFLMFPNNQGKIEFYARRILICGVIPKFLT